MASTETPFDPKSFKGLFFDIYATLIDWEDPIYRSLRQLTNRLPEDDARRADNKDNKRTLLKSYAANEKVVEGENPTLPYPQILERVYERIASQLGVSYSHEEAVAFGYTIGEWGAFPDTVKAMQTLAKYYKLFALSNVDNESFGRTLAGPLKGVKFDDIYTAQMIGSYKPHPDNYNYVVKRLGEEWDIPKDQTLLVAQSLDIDHYMAHKLGFKPAVWITRRGPYSVGGMGGDREALEAAGEIKLGAVYETLGEFADAVEKAFQQK